MNNVQIKKVNKVVFIMIICMVGYILLSQCLFCITQPSDVSGKTYAQITASIFAIISCVISYIMKKEYMNCAVIMFSAMEVLYFVIRMCGKSEEMGMYAFPLMVISIAYLNIKCKACLCRLTCFVLFIIKILFNNIKY